MKQTKNVSPMSSGKKGRLQEGENAMDQMEKKMQTIWKETSKVGLDLDRGTAVGYIEFMNKWAVENEKEE